MSTEQNPARTLRVLSVNVQVNLVWDDGETLTPGPQVAPVALPASSLATFVEQMPEQVEHIRQESERQAAETAAHGHAH